MGPVVISVVVVGACIGWVTWFVLGTGSDEDATAPARSGRVERPARAPRPPRPTRPRPIRPPAAAARPRPAPGPAVAVPFGPRLSVRTPWWVRVRSAVALVGLSVGLGFATAIGVGVTLVVLYALLRASVG